MRLTLLVELVGVGVLLAVEGPAHLLGLLGVVVVRDQVVDGHAGEPIAPLTITPASTKSGAGPNDAPSRGPDLIVIRDSGSHINDHGERPAALGRAAPPCCYTDARVSHCSMTRSACNKTDGGIGIPSALAVLRLMINSNVVGCSTGRSAGAAPFRIRSTK